jgi:hypothetical protein
MEYIPVFVVMFLVVGIIAWRWAVGIDYMQKNHPDYKGEDFLNWNSDKEETENDKTQIL